MQRTGKTEKIIVVAIMLLILLIGFILYIGTMQENSKLNKPVTVEKDAIQTMVKYGFNCFRLRLFVNPLSLDEWGGFTGNNLSYTIALAKRIKATGAKLLLDFHYSDTWADPGHQTKPKAWEGLDFSALVDMVYNYTYTCIATMKQEGVLPDMVQPGNEITNGMLWPDGQLYGVGKPEEQWEKFAHLLKAAIQGVKDAAGSDNVKIVLHTDSGGNWQTTQWFFENIEKQGVPYDIIGLSYYPWWSGSIDNLRENLTKTATRFDKDILIAETAYPYSYLDLSKVAYSNQANMLWPETPEGQKSYLTELVQIVRETPNNHGLGVLWWYPESIPVKGLTIWNGGTTALFDQNGTVLPAMDVFENAHEEQGAKEFLTGGDISTLAAIEEKGGVFRDIEDSP